MRTRYAVAVVFAMAITFIPLAPAAATTGTLDIDTDTTLTENHFGNIVVNADNVDLDCAGFTIRGTGSGTGIEVTDRDAVTIRNCEVVGFEFGILLIGVANSTVVGNSVWGNTNAGIALNTSQDNVVRGNEAQGNSFSGIDVFQSTGNVLDSNFAGSGQYGFVLFESSNNALTGNQADVSDVGIHLNRADENLLEGNRVDGSTREGIGFFASSRNVITGNLVRDNFTDGIHLGEGSDDNVLSLNTATRNMENGFSTWMADGTVFSNNVANSNGQSGFGISDSHRWRFEGNEAYRNQWGLGAWGSTGGVIVDNNIYRNGRDGIHLGEGSHQNDVTGNVSDRNVGAGFSTYRADSNTFTSNTSNGNFEWGLILNESSDNVVRGSSVANTGRSGLVVWSDSIATGRSINNRLIDNVVTNSTYEGMTVGGADGTIVTGNTIVTNGTSGITLGARTSNTVVKGNRVSENVAYGIGTWGTASATIAGNTADDNGTDGIHLGEDSFDNTVNGNTLSGNGGHGISLFRADGNEVSDNRIRESGSVGVSVGESFGNTVADNASRWNDIHGFEIWGSGSAEDPNLFANNRAQGNGQIGLVVSESHYTTASRNYILQNRTDGIAVLGGSSHTVIDDNQIVSNGATGISVWDSDANTLSGNTLASNGDKGVLVALGSNNVLVGNTASGHDKDGSDGNYGSGFSLIEATNTTVENNQASSNYHGFRLDDSDNNILTGNVSERNVVGFDIVASNRNTLEGNTARRNGERSGFELRDGSALNALRDNTADHNAWAGFTIEDADRNVIDHNFASHNKLGFIGGGGSTRNTFSNNFARNAWWDGADWSSAGTNRWINNDFKWTTGIPPVGPPSSPPASPPVSGAVTPLYGGAVEGLGGSAGLIGTIVVALGFILLMANGAARAITAEPVSTTRGRRRKPSFSAHIALLLQGFRL